MNLYHEILEEYFSCLKRVVLRYTGFKFYSLVLLCCLASSVLLVSSRTGALSLTNLLNGIWFEYLWTFWSSHLGFLLVFAVIFAAVIVFNILEGPFSRRVQLPVILSRQDIRTERMMSRLNWYLSGTFLGSFLVVVPIVHLWLPSWYNATVFVAGFVSSFVSAWVGWAQSCDREFIHRLGSYRFRGRPSFDTASMGAEPIEVKQELAHYDRLQQISPINGRVREYLWHGSQNHLWQGLREFYESLASFFQVPAVWITTHQNTTKAIRHALKLCVNDDTTVITTDLEFPSVLKTISDVTPAERQSIIEVKDSHLRERLDYREILDMVADEVNRLGAASNDTRLVVVLSHVTYLTGAVLDIHRLQEKLSIDRNRILLIVDGAQAAGNINVGRSFIEDCDFYASSGHKWLLGKTTLGILIHEPDNVYKKLDLDLQQIRESTLPFSHIDYDSGDYRGETVDLEQIVSLNAMLVEFNAMDPMAVADHNRILARLFKKLVTPVRGVFVISSPVQSGIVSVRIKGARAVADALESDFDYIGQVVESDILRFSFHYYMEQRDVHRLVEALNNVMNRESLNYAQLHRAVTGEL